MSIFSSSRKLSLLLASTLTTMSGATISASLPLISETFADNPDAAYLSRLVLTVPALLIAICSPLVGWAVDRVGRLRLLFLGLVLYAVGGTAGGLVNSLEAILISRAILGVAVGLVMTASSTLIADYYEGGERADLLGKQAAAQSIGGILFITLGGILADVNWRAPFFIYLLSILIIPLAWKALKEPQKSVNQPVEQDEVNPAVENYWPISIAMFLTIFLGMVIFYLAPVQLPFLLAEMDVSSTMVGLAIAAITLSGAVTSLTFNRIRKFLSPAWLLVFAFCSLGAGYLIVSQTVSYTVVVLGMLVSGLGVGVLMPNINQVLMNKAPQARRGFLLGILSSSLFIGQFMSPIAAAPLIERFGLNETFGVVGGGSILAGLIYLAYALLAKKESVLTT